MKNHGCKFPIWGDWVAVGTTWDCPKCGRSWWLNENYKWEGEDVIHNKTRARVYREIAYHLGDDCFKAEWYLQRANEMDKI